MKMDIGVDRRHKTSRSVAACAANMGGLTEIPLLHGEESRAQGASSQLGDLTDRGCRIAVGFNPIVQRNCQKSQVRTKGGHLIRNEMRRETSPKTPTGCLAHGGRLTSFNCRARCCS